MKQLLFIDFETYWESRKGGYGLKQMSMVEYVRDPRFKAFGMGVCGPDNKPEWITGKDIPRFIDMIARQVGWPNVALVCHNTKFDGMILREIYECVPGQFIDTKGMSKGVLGKTVKNHSLATVAEHFGMQPKGTMRTDGLKELTKAQEAELAEYCIHDVELCRQIYKKLEKEFPVSQYEVMHRTIEMFVCPKLVLNVALLEKTNAKEAERRTTIFNEIGIPKADFSSNQKFAALLKNKGYDCPTKPSPRQRDTNGEPINIPALALGDTEFVSLMENGNEELKALCEARIAAKSNLLETRSAKLAAIGRTGNWPFDVEFSGADQTHRFSGGSGAGGNPQNFTRNSALREAVEAPEGFELVVGDFDKIECRMVAYLSRDPGLIAAIEGDAYSAFASNYYGRKITKADEKERRFGKCVAENTLVVTDHGCKTIQDVTAEDKVWDGSEFVEHEGLIDNGTRETVSFSRLWLTPDHLVLCGTQWKETRSVVQDENLRFLALDRASVKLSSLDTSEGREGVLLASFESAIVDHRNGWLTSQISRLEEQRAVTFVLRKPDQKNATGNTLTQWPTMSIELDYSTVYQQLSQDAIIQKIGCISITENEEYGFMTIGVPTKRNFCALFKLSEDGTSKLLKWIEPMSTADIYRATYALCLEQKTWLTVAASEISKRVYDLRNSGPHNRFTVLTADGPVIVHNCAILGLGYNMGYKKFQKTVKLQTGQDISEDASKRGVDLYREMYNKVPALWEYLNNVIPFIAEGKAIIWPFPGKIGFQYVELPSGLRMRYPNLRPVIGKKARAEWVYDVWKKGHLEQAKLYGGKLLENISQALSGELCKEAMLKFDSRVTGLVHDEIHVVCKKGLGLQTKMALQRAMTVSPKWFPELKLKCETGVGPNWASAK